MRFFEKNKTLLARFGFFIIVIALLLVILIGIEFFVGNGDGVWFDYDLRLIGFKISTWVVSLVVLLLLIRNVSPLIQNLILSFFSVVFVILGIEMFVGWIHDAGQKPFDPSGASIRRSSL